MGELKIGGFKNNPSSAQNYDIDLSGVEPTEPVVTPTEPVEPITPTEPVQPTEPVEPSTEPVQPTNPDGTPSKDSSLTPEPVKPQHTIEINDESALKYLSEKLGKPIQSFDDLTTQDVIVNPLDNDPYLKKLYEWREKTGRPIEDWIKYQKDYNSVQDLDVAREFLQYEYPTLTKEEINLELRKFIPSDDDLDDEAAVKQLELKKYATKGRGILSQFVTDLGEPLSSVKYPQEVQQDLELARQVKRQYSETQKAQQSYVAGISTATNSLDTFKLSLTDEMSLDFKISEQSKKEIPSMIDTMPHWRNPDGSWNHKAVVEDAVKIKHFDEIVKLVYEQGLNAGKDNLIKDTKNINLNQPTPAASNNDGSKGVVIEDLDEYLGKGGIRVRFGKK